MATEFPDSTSVRVTRSLNAPPERVWRALTEPTEMAAWMWAGWGSDTTAAADLRIGGRYEVYTTAARADPTWPRQRWGFFGYYTEIVPQHRLAYTLHWDGPVGYNQAGQSIADEAVIVDLAEAGAETLVTRWHVGIPPVPGAAGEHGRGIEAEFDALDELLAG